MQSPCFDEDGNFEHRIRWGFNLLCIPMFFNDVLRRGLSYLYIMIRFHKDLLNNILSRMQDNLYKLKCNDKFNIALGIGVGLVSFMALSCIFPYIINSDPGTFNHTLALLGGGAKSAGGLGMVGGISIASLATGITSYANGGIIYKFKKSIDKNILINDLISRNLDEFTCQVCCLLIFIEFSCALNKGYTANCKETVNLLIDCDSKLKYNCFVKNEHSNDELNNKVKILRNLFVRLEEI